MNKIVSFFVLLVFVFLVNSCTTAKNTNSTQGEKNFSTKQGSEIVSDYTKLFVLELVEERDGSQSYTISGYLGRSRMVEVPEKIEGIPVTKIGKYAFCTAKFQDGTTGNAITNISYIKLPDSIIEIGHGAFMYCRDLMSIILPSKMIKIGDHAFESCNLLRAITLPDTVEEIGIFSFSFCRELTTIRISKNIAIIGSYAFSGSKKLTNITFPETLLEEIRFGRNVFNNCENLSISSKNELTKKGYDFEI
jgi:hypothetical protein